MTTLPRYRASDRSPPSEPRNVKSGAARGGSNVPAFRAASSARTAVTANASSRSVARIRNILQRNRGRLGRPGKAVVHVRLVWDRVLQRSRIDGELHQLLELG